MDGKKPAICPLGFTPSQLLRRFLFAMADVDHEKRPWAAATVICTWLTLTFFHDACAIQSQRAIDSLIETKDSLYIPIFMTLVETSMCISMIRIGKYGSNLESISVAIFGHVFGSFLVNRWVQVSQPEFGVIGALIEPVVCLLLLNVCKSTCASVSRTISVGLISCGFVLLTMNVQTILNTDRSVIIRLLCGVFYILRNMVVSYWHEENIPVDRRSGRSLTVIVFVLLCAGSGFMFFLPFSWFIPLLFGFLTCCLHVYVTYITCAMLLAKVSIPTLCLLTAFIQCIETQILMTSSHRASILVVAVACVLVAAGVYLYTVDAVETGHTFQTRKAVSTNEMLTRIQFLMFISCILGVLFYVLQPRVSSRDLNTLSYVGLDKVIRRLLSLEQPDGHQH